MKHLNQFITEYIIKKKLDKPIDSEDHYKYFPKTKEELKKNIKECLDSNNYDLNCIDTSKITDMSWLFENVKHNFDISSWDVSNIKSMRSMFHWCKELKSVGDISEWNVSNVTKMMSMFYKCEELKSVVDISGWDVSNVRNHDIMFLYCSIKDEYKPKFKK